MVPACRRVGLSFGGQVWFISLIVPACRRFGQRVGGQVIVYGLIV